MSHLLPLSVMLCSPLKTSSIGVVCGAASQNLAVIDAETTLAFETQLRRCELAGIADTWIDETFRGGHILTRLPTAVKPKSFKSEGFEVRGQGQYVHWRAIW